MVPGVELDKYATGHEMWNQRSEKPDLPQHKTESSFWKTGGHLQLRSSLFCTAQSAFAVEICAQMGQIAGMAWKNSSATLLLERLQLQPWQPYRSQIFHCMVAWIELEQYATDNEMSN